MPQVATHASITKVETWPCSGRGCGASAKAPVPQDAHGDVTEPILQSPRLDGLEPFTEIEDREFFLQMPVRHLVLRDVQQSAVVVRSHQDLVCFLQEGNKHPARSLLCETLEAASQCAANQMPEFSILMRTRE